MSESQNYGVLRVVGINQALYTNGVKKNRALIDAPVHFQEQYTTEGLPDEHLVHLLTRREVTIGRALDNDVILLDPTASREHVRLVLKEQQYWLISNVAVNNTVCINGKPVAAGADAELHPQDYIQIGSTLLQLVARQCEENQQAADAGIGPEGAGLPLHTFLPYRIIALNGTREKMQSGNGVPQLSKTAGGETWHGEEAGMWEKRFELKLMLAQRLGVSLRWVLFVVGLLVLALGVVSLLALNSSSFSVLIQQGPLNLIGALTIPVIPALGITLLVHFIDRYEREPWFLRLAAFLWGATIAIPSAVFIEQFFDSLITSTWGPDSDMALHALLQGLNFGVTEETVKGLGLLLLFVVLRDEFDNVTDGVVYGALIGAGFAMVENFFYFTDNTADWPVLIVGRIVLGWLCHSTFTVCFGAALGYIRHTRVRWQQYVIPLIGYVLSIGLHTAFDFVNLYVKELVPAVGEVNGPVIMALSVIVALANYVLPFIAQMFILYIVMRALAHEAAIIREFLAAEVGTGVITVEEYTLLQNSFIRMREEQRVLRQRGLKQWWYCRNLYQAAIGLAFRKWHVSMGDKPKLGYVQPEEAYRQHIKSLKLKRLKEGQRIRKD